MLIVAAHALPAQQLESLWYSTSGEKSTASFLAHASQISIVSPQVFALNAQGVIHGKVDPRVIAAAREHRRNADAELGQGALAGHQGSGRDSV
jgi:hypothetical protein